MLFGKKQTEKRPEPPDPSKDSIGQKQKKVPFVITRTQKSRTPNAAGIKCLVTRTSALKQPILALYAQQDRRVTLQCKTTIFPDKLAHSQKKTLRYKNFSSTAGSNFVNLQRPYYFYSLSKALQKGTPRKPGRVLLYAAVTPH